MNLEEKLQAKVKELDALKTRMAELDTERQKTFQHALEVQGAAKQLIELVNAQKAEAAKKMLPSMPVVNNLTSGKKKKAPAELKIQEGVS